MFKKLVANLPFSPGLISQVGFYADRLKQERSIRRLSFLFIALTMVIQIVAVAAPPERSLAASSNHIINGLRTKTDILDAWDQTGSDVPAIYEFFGVTRDDIVALPTNPNSKIKSTDADYWSIGRNSLSGYSRIDPSFKNSQLSLQYGGIDTSTTVDDQYVYQRELRAWDVKNPSNTYDAFKGTTAEGVTFWILVDCGNLTQIGKYTPPPDPETPDPPKPKVKIRKTIANAPTTLNPGDTYTYQIEYKNTVKNTIATDVIIQDQLDIKHFSVVSPTNLPITNGFLNYEVGGLDYSEDYKVISITVRLKDQITSGTDICNTARITGSNVNVDTSKVCIGVITVCPFDKNIADVNNPNCVEPKLVCSVVDASLNRTTREVIYKTTVTSTNPANTTIKKYSYDFGDDETKEVISNLLTNEVSHTYQAGDYESQVTITFRTTGQSEGNDKSIDCTAPISFDEDQPLGQTKIVENITQAKEGDAAIDSVVVAGDVLEYTLTTINSQNYDRTNIDIADYIGDILDYATIDIDFLNEQKGKFDKDTNKLVWSNITIPANSAATQSFRVTIKDPIPSTNSPSSVSTDFDCKISNEYGNEITMNVGCPLVKGLETLPNTGPGSSIVMMSSVTVIVGYFFARSRMLEQEINIVRRDYVATGGV